MWRRGSWRFYFGLPPYGFHFHKARPGPSKEEYLSMLEDYKRNLEDEVEVVKKEIEEIKKGA
jgi:hypothetical protein